MAAFEGFGGPFQRITIRLASGGSWGGLGGCWGGRVLGVSWGSLEGLGGFRGPFFFQKKRTPCISAIKQQLASVGVASNLLETPNMSVNARFVACTCLIVYICIVCIHVELNFTWYPEPKPESSCGPEGLYAYVTYLRACISYSLSLLHVYCTSLCARLESCNV